MASGSYAGDSEKPPVTSRMSPASCTAVNSTCTTKPSPAPMATSVTAVTTRKPGVGSGSPGVIRCSTATASASASAPFTGAGMPRELNGGASSTKPAARQVASSNPARVTAGTERSIAASGPRQQARQHVEQRLGEGHHLVEDPVAGDQQRDRHGDHLRNEGEGLLLDLGGRLEQRDQEPDQQRRQQDGGGDPRRHRHGLDGELGDVGVAHGYPDP